MCFKVWSLRFIRIESLASISKMLQLVTDFTIFKLSGSVVILSFTVLA